MAELFNSGYIVNYVNLPRLVENCGDVVIKHMIQVGTRMAKIGLRSGFGDVVQFMFPMGKSTMTGYSQGNFWFGSFSKSKKVV